MFPMTIYCWDPGEDWNFRLAPGGSHRADVQRFKSWGGDRPRQCLTIGTMVEGKGWWYVDVRGCSWRLMNAFAIVDPMKRGKNMEKYGTIWINMEKYGTIWKNAWCSGSPLNMERFFFVFGPITLKQSMSWYSEFDSLHPLWCSFCIWQDYDLLNKLDERVSKKNTMGRNAAGALRETWFTSWTGSSWNLLGFSEISIWIASEKTLVSWI